MTEIFGDNMHGMSKPIFWEKKKKKKKKISSSVEILNHNTKQ